MLAERVALVTGASSGIGRATALALAREGARIALAARSESALEAVAAAVEAEGAEALVVPMNVRDRDQVAAGITATVQWDDRLDVLVNAAGVGYWDNEGIVDGVLDDWIAEVETNLLGTMMTTHYAASTMVEQGTGDIVTISSGADQYPHGEYPGYVTSKHGVSAFTRAAWNDLKGTGVRTTLVSPGEVDTPMQTDEGRDARRILDPEDVADTVVYALTRPEHVLVNELRVSPSLRG